MSRSPALEHAIQSAPWSEEGRSPTAMELERWLTSQRPSIRVEYLAGMLTEVAEGAP